MFIGQVSKLTGATPKAIRLYEEMGLLVEVGRSGKYRVYDQHHVVIISMIKRAQAMGFKLADMAPLVEIKHQENRFPLEVAIQAINEKRAQIRAEIEAAKALDHSLSALTQELQTLFKDAE